MRRADAPSFGPVKRVLWRFLWYPARLLALVIFRINIRKEGPFPEGPVIVAPNHLAHPDPPFVGLAVRKPMRFLALDELWGHSRIMDRVFRVFGAIPLPRSRYPLSAMRLALTHLGAGGVVGVFPEGRRVQRWGDETPRRGAAWLAFRSGAPIVPVAVWGTQHAMPIGTFRLRPSKVWVRVGTPIDPDAYLDRVDPLGAVMETWRAWIESQLRDVAEAAGPPAPRQGE